MQFLLHASDGTDPHALDRRMASRPNHISEGINLVADGRMLYGGAVLDHAGTMTGSMVVYDFPSRIELDEWLLKEPYVTDGVWDEIRITRSVRRGSPIPDNEPRDQQFLLIAHDGKDPEALERRLSVRQDHLNACDELIEAGNILYTSALLGDKGEMVGSMLVLDFSSRITVDSWLETEPYVMGNVWQEISVYPFQVGSLFVGLANS